MPKRHVFNKTLDSTSQHEICAPRKKIAFLKVHKCASSSIQSILLRYGLKHSLNFVFNTTGYSFWNKKGETFQRSMIKGTLWEQAKLKYDLFVLHARWNHTEISKLMEDTGNVFYLANLRDPVDTFRSAWDFVEKNYHQSHGVTLEEFSRNLLKPKNISSNNSKPISSKFSYFFPRFGFTMKDIEDEESVKRKILDIEKMFDMILITDTEFIESSFIILMDALCWEYSDMVNFKQNLANPKEKSFLSSTARQALKGNGIETLEKCFFFLN